MTGAMNEDGIVWIARVHWKCCSVQAGTSRGARMMRKEGLTETEDLYFP